MKTKRESPILSRSSTLVTPAPLRQVLDATCRRDLATFAGRCFQTLSPGTPYLPNWHHRALAYHLEQVDLSKIRRSIINMQPRSGKSMFCSVALPLFALGHDPSKRIVVISYGQDLAVKLSNDRRAILNSPWYQRLFPGTRVSGMKNTEAEFTTTRFGGCLATSIDGPAIGRGGQLIIIDDPLKPGDALSGSGSKREHANEWVRHTLLSRLDNKQTDAIVVVMQRLHVEDLTGMLLRSSSDWTLLKLPTIAQEEEKIQIGEDQYHIRHVGDLLHPEREPKWVLDSLKGQIGPDNWAAQYEQSPLPPDGGIFKPNWVPRYDRLPDRNSSTQIIQSWDTAFKEGGQNDYSACATFMLHDNKYYLMHMLRDRFNYGNLRTRVIEHAQVYKPTILLIEEAGFGIGLLDELPKLGLSPIGIQPKLNKLTRASIQSAKFQCGQVIWPESAVHHPWLPEAEAELFAFPHVRHDDQVDAICQALAHEISDYDYLLNNVGSFSDSSREAELIRRLNNQRKAILEGRDLSQWPKGYDI